MIIKKLYEFLELNKSYPYTFLRDDGDCYRRCFIHQFTTPMDTYIVNLIVYNSDNEYTKYISFEWSNKDDFDNPDKNYVDKKTNKNINLNEVFKILNTVFKILFDFMKKHKIRRAKIGSYNKNKYKTYKKIIEEENDYKILRDFKMYKDGEDIYAIEFINNNIPFNTTNPGSSGLSERSIT